MCLCVFMCARVCLCVQLLLASVVKNLTVLICLVILLIILCVQQRRDCSVVVQKRGYWCQRVNESLDDLPSKMHPRAFSVEG